jgi:CRISPR system Cascade subunit CasE
MHLSQLILNPRNRQVRSELACPYEMHRTISRAFGDDLSDERILYRVDVDRRTGVPTVLVQSQTEPDWSALPDDGYLLEPADSKSVDPGFSEGQLLNFRLRANPVKRDADTGKRLGLLEEEDQREWLDRKGQRNGFRVVRCHVIPEGLKKFDKRSGGTERKVTLASVRYEGVLQVTDPAALLEAMEGGIGPAKAFGFGLLSLAKA